MQNWAYSDLLKSPKDCRQLEDPSRGGFPETSAEAYPFPLNSVTVHGCYILKVKKGSLLSIHAESDDIHPIVYDPPCGFRDLALADQEEHVTHQPFGNSLRVIVVKWVVGKRSVHGWRRGTDDIYHQLANFELEPLGIEQAPENPTPVSETV